MATRLFLIRHGQTDFNVQGRYCGLLDIGLNAKGRQQAKKLKRRMQNISIDAVYASDRRRALETASLVFKKPTVKRKKHLREMHFGAFEGLTHPELLKRHPRLYQRWLKNPFSAVIPKGETAINFQKRATGAITDIARCHPGQTVAIVCHGGTIAMFLAHVKKTKNFWKNIPGAASLTVITWRGEKFKIEKSNDTTQLKKKTYL